jgi:hypothetical protein
VRLFMMLPPGRTFLLTITLLGLVLFVPLEETKVQISVGTGVVLGAAVFLLLRIKRAPKTASPVKFSVAKLPTVDLPMGSGLPASWRPGLVGEYCSDPDLKTIVFRRVDASTRFSRQNEAALSAVERGVSVRWTGYLYAPSNGDYAFWLEGPGRFRVQLGGRDIVKENDKPGTEPVRLTRFLSRGVYPIKIEYAGDAGPGLVLFKAEAVPPIAEEATLPAPPKLAHDPGRFIPFPSDKGPEMSSETTKAIRGVELSDLRPGLIVECHSGEAFKTVERKTSDLGAGLCWGDPAAPGADGLRIFKWSGYLRAARTGLYVFETEDRVKVMLDGACVIDNSGGETPGPISGERALEEGFHQFLVEYCETSPNATKTVRWKEGAEAFRNIGPNDVSRLHPDQEAGPPAASQR